MRHFSTSSLPRLLSLLYITLFLHTTTTLARPTTDPQTISSLPNHDSLPTLLHSSNATPSIQPRGLPVTHYNNLGPWKMVLTSASLFFDPTTQLTTPASKLVDFFAKVAAEAATLSATNAAETTAMDFGQGAIQFGVLLRDGYGSPATIPWSLVARLATEFMLRADRGNPTAFRAQVLGPLKPNILGGQPWIEVVLVVGGKVLMDGIHWAIF